MCDSTLFHIRRKPNISLSFPHRAKTADRSEPSHLPKSFKKEFILSNQQGKDFDITKGTSATCLFLLERLKCLQNCAIITV